jgi:hypothetical protein
VAAAASWKVGVHGNERIIIVAPCRRVVRIVLDPKGYVNLGLVARQVSTDGAPINGAGARTCQ